MDPRTAYAAWQAGEIAIVDVREELEHEATRVAGVPLLPMSEIAGRLDELPGGPLAILCRIGARSGQVADFLTARGEHGDVANIEGGILAWAADGLPYEGEPPS